MLRAIHIALLVALAAAMPPYLLTAQPHGARTIDTIKLDSLSSELQSHLSNRDYSDYASCAQTLSELYVSSGQFDKAIALYDQAGEVCRQHNLFKWYGVFNKNIAEIDFMLGRTNASRELLEELSGTPEIPDYEMTAIRFRLGDLECDLGNYDRGIELLESSLDLAESSEYDVLLGSIYTELGLCNHVTGNKVSAIDYLIKAIPHLSAPKHSRVLGHNYLLLAELFDDIGQRDKSAEYLYRGKQLAERDNYDRLYYRALYLEGRSELASGNFNRMSQLDSAYQFYANNFLYLQAVIVALDIASAYIRNGAQEIARSYLARAESLLPEIENPIQTAKYYEILSRYFILSQDLNPAREAFNQNRMIVDSLGGQLLTQRSLALEVDLLQAERRFNDALLASFRYHAYKDSINTLAQSRILFDTEAKYRKKESEREIELLSTQNQIKDLEIQRASRRNSMLLLGIAALLAMIGFGVYSYRLKQHTNKELAKKNNIVSEALSEKELLLKEIHHRVKNNLEVISGLLYLQSKYIEDENVLEAIREGQNRVRSMSLIHKNLYQDDNLTGIRMDEYLDKLLDTLLKSYKVGNNNITLNKAIEPLNLDVDTVIPLALIINELVSNSLKYALDKNDNAELSVSLQKNNQTLALRVSDNGPGLPDNFDIAKTNSLGYKLIDMFSQKLEGTLSIANNNGANIILRFNKFKIV